MTARRLARRPKRGLDRPSSGSTGRRGAFLLCRDREIFETSALLGDVEGECLGGLARAGVLHVMHFAGRGAEGLPALKRLWRFALNLQDRRTVQDIHDFAARLGVLAAFSSWRQLAQDQNGFQSLGARQI